MIAFISFILAVIGWLAFVRLLAYYDKNGGNNLEYVSVMVMATAAHFTAVFLDHYVGFSYGPTFLFFVILPLAIMAYQFIHAQRQRKNDIA